MFGNRLKQIRKEKGLTQKELAQLLGVSSGAIGLYEQNRRTPDIETIKRIAKILGVGPSYFLEETPEKKFTGDKRVYKIPAEYLDLFEPDNLEYIKFIQKMKKEKISPKLLAEVFDTILKVKKGK